MYRSSVIFFFKQKTAYEMRISDWSSDVCSSDLTGRLADLGAQDRVLAQAYLAFLRGGGNPDLFADGFTDLTEAYFAFVRGGGDPAAFTGASAATLDSYIRFLADRGLVQQLAAADRALLLAYLGNGGLAFPGQYRSEEHTSELPSLIRISYAVFCLNNKLNTIILNTFIIA